MASNSTIEWTTHTFNPWWGCTKVSDGCKYCYAESLANRWGHSCWGPKNPRRIMTDQHWIEPLKWNAEAYNKGRRARVFCASMADVFEERAPQDQYLRLWDMIRKTPNLDWQLLTKRPHLIAQKLPEDWGEGYQNVWLGTSVEDARVVDRIHHLATVPAIVRFLSLEPLIGPLPNLPLQNIHWAIVGGESGTQARPICENWVLDIRDQCDQTGVAFFFKQWGGRNKKESGRELQSQYYDNFPAILERVLVAPQAQPSRRNMTLHVV